MFGSQALETAIGLVAMFFIIAFAASSIVEIYSRLLSKRAGDLESTLKAMLAGPTAGDSQLEQDAEKALEAFKGTSVYESLQAAAGTTLFRNRPKRPSYLSAKAFADAVVEMVDKGEATATVPKGLEKRMTPLVREVGSNLTAIRAGLERWFDETMARLEGSYKRWVTLWLVVVGLVVAVAANASTFDVAEKLWRDPVTRESVAASAERLTQNPATREEITTVAQASDALEELGLPVGWNAAARAEWEDWWQVWNWSSSNLGTALGWLVTALLVMLGAPFWFDVLTRLASLRSAGAKPAPATDDDASASKALAAEGAQPGTLGDDVLGALGWTRTVTPG
jgi:hypothetical protein